MKAFTKGLPFAPAVALVIVAIWEIAFVIRDGGEVATVEQWRAVSAAVRADLRSGDLITFAPKWIDPLGRQYLGDLMPVNAIAALDTKGFPRIWEVSVRGAHATEVRNLTLAREQVLGPVTLRLFHQPKVTTTANLVRDFSTADVSGAIARSPRVVLTEVGFMPRRCILAEPQPNGEISIRYPHIRLGRLLVVGVGLADIFTRRDIREPATVHLEINGESALELSVGIDDGWKHVEVPTTPTTSAEIVFRVRAPVKQRMVCFASEARE